MVLQYSNVSLEYRWLTIHLKKKENTIHVDINDFVITNLRGQYLQKGILEQILYRGPYIYEVHEVCPIFNFHSSIFKRPTPPPHPASLPPSQNNNQSIKRIHNPRMTITLLLVVFVFSINSWILSGFPLTSFHLVEANLVPRAIFKNQKSFLPFSRSEKACRGYGWAEASLSTLSWL